MKRSGIGEDSKCDAVKKEAKKARGVGAPSADRKEEIYQELLYFYNDGSDYGGVSQYAHACQCAWQAKQAGADEETQVAGLLHDIGWKLAGTEPFVIDAAVKKTGETSRAKGLPGEGPPVAPSEAELKDNDNADLKAPSMLSIAAKLGILQTTSASEDSASLEAQRAQHDTIGATFLRMRGFAEKCAHLIEGHVLAKRYLCYKEPGYHDELSPGSKRTLVFQGGPMTAAEATLFESDPLFEASKQMRRWDEAAKETGLKVDGFQNYKDMILRCLREPERTASETLDHCTYTRKGNVIVGLRGAGEASKDGTEAE